MDLGPQPEESPESLSEHLREQAIAWMPVVYAIGNEYLEGQNFDSRNQLVAYLVRCRESIEPENKDVAISEEFINSHRKLIEDWLDSYYVLQQIWAVPEKVQRTLGLSMLSAIETPSDQTNRYLAEANRCYIHGFMLAAVAMARAALEQSLKERFAMLGDREVQILSLGSLIERASQRNAVLSSDAIRIARDLAGQCNRVMHNRPPRDDHTAENILIGARFLIMQIFSGS